MRGVEVSGEKVRRPAAVYRFHRVLIPVRTAHLPVSEPDLLRRAVHILEIVHAGVSEQRLETIRVTGDPVRHVSAVGSACRSHPSGIEPAVAGQSGVETVHQIGINFSGPVFGNLICELLAVAEGASRIDRYDSETR